MTYSGYLTLDSYLIWYLKKWHYPPYQVLCIQLSVSSHLVCILYNPFFEYNKINPKNTKSQYYKNPEQGLIVLDQITNIKRFEFFIQPQKVNIGSATPTYFHAAYGNMNFPELLIQLTYWTTYIYPNWQNAVRVPHVIKMAEKLATMTAKFTQSKLSENLYDTQSFL